MGYDLRGIKMNDTVNLSLANFATIHFIPSISTLFWTLLCMFLASVIGLTIGIGISKLLEWVLDELDELGCNLSLKTWYMGIVIGLLFAIYFKM